jgi:hypothetical protein
MWISQSVAGCIQPVLVCLQAVGWYSGYSWPLNNVHSVQGDLARKVRCLKDLEVGARAVLQATVAPCTELNVAETLSAMPQDESLACQDLVGLPGPLYVLSSELRIVQVLHRMPIQVSAVQLPH